MPTRVVIVGDLPGRPERKELLDLLAGMQPAIRWDWIQPVTAAFNLPTGPFKRLLAELRQNKNDGSSIVIVKLAHLHGRDEGALYAAYPDPLLPRHDLHDVEQLATWLCSRDAGIVTADDLEWVASIRAAALLALLSKLIRNKSWNKDQQGHQWTKEQDLLRQAPVYTPDGKLYGEACEIIGRGWPLLLRKGGKQGKTPLEWCIQIKYLPAVKKAIAQRSLLPLREVPELATIMAYIGEGSPETVVVDNKIVSERVRGICRDQRE